MSERNQKVLSLMVEDFRALHGAMPKKITVAPVALVALSAKKSVAPTWQGIPVECRLFEASEVVKKGSPSTTLGVFVRERRGITQLVACNLK